MASGLLLHLRDHTKIDLLDRQTVQIAVQENIQIQDLLITELLINRNKRVPDNISFHNNYHEKLMFLNSGELDKFKLRLAVTRSADQSRIICILCENLCKLLQKQFHAVNPLDHQFLHVLDLTVLLFNNLVNIKPVTLIGRNPSG